VPPTRRQAILVCVFAAVTALMCAALLTAAALAPAPAAALPILALVGVGCPMAAGTELPAAIRVLRLRRVPSALDPREVEALRRELDQLPETRHPLGL
jgi:hypothetical protein